MIGARTLVAATCRRCGGLFGGEEFRRHRRNRRDPRPYLDLRCKACQWKMMEAKL